MIQPAMRKAKTEKQPGSSAKAAPRAVERDVTIAYEAGLHLRAAGRFVDTASKFRSDITVKLGNRKVDGKSIIDMLTLGATMGTELRIRAEGGDAVEAVDQLEALVARNFAAGE